MNNSQQSQFSNCYSIDNVLTFHSVEVSSKKAPVSVLEDVSSHAVNTIKNKVKQDRNSLILEMSVFLNGEIITFANKLEFHNQMLTPIDHFLSSKTQSKKLGSQTQQQQLSFCSSSQSLFPSSSSQFLFQQKSQQQSMTQQPQPNLLPFLQQSNSIIKNKSTPTRTSARKLEKLEKKDINSSQFQENEVSYEPCITAQQLLEDVVAKRSSSQKARNLIDLEESTISQENESQKDNNELRTVFLLTEQEEQNNEKQENEEIKSENTFLVFDNKDINDDSDSTNLFKKLDTDQLQNVNNCVISNNHLQMQYQQYQSKQKLNQYSQQKIKKTKKPTKKQQQQLAAKAALVFNIDSEEEDEDDDSSYCSLQVSTNKSLNIEQLKEFGIFTNRKNAVKNIVKAFHRFLACPSYEKDILTDTDICEKGNGKILRDLRKCMARLERKRKYNQQLIYTIYSSDKLNYAFRLFLNIHAFSWLQESKIQDQDIYFEVLKDYQKLFNSL